MRTLPGGEGSIWWRQEGRDAGGSIRGRQAEGRDARGISLEHNLTREHPDASQHALACAAGGGPEGAARLLIQHSHLEVRHGGVDEPS